VIVSLIAAPPQPIPIVPGHIEKMKSHNATSTPRNNLSADHIHQTFLLQDEIPEKSLQVIVRLYSIGTPETPDYTSDSDFHVENLFDEHILEHS
jgi:hypothetical protein